MGSDDLFKKRRAAKNSKERKHGIKEPATQSYLIVTEGEKTEPLYLEGIKRKIQASKHGKIDIKTPEIYIEGQGASTRKLIDITEDIVRRSKIFYQKVWVVFDKDSFKDFDEAIKVAQDKGYQVAWSNQCFEYWIYLHFAYSDSALHRDEWINKLNEIFKKNNISGGKYKKSDKTLFDELDKSNRVQKAISHAKHRMKEFEFMRKENPKVRASEFDPGTTFYKLIEELREYL